MAQIVIDLAGQNEWTKHLVQRLVLLGEYDILHHLYKYGPKEGDLWTLYWRHCYRDWDIFLTDLKLRLEFNQND